MTARLGIVLLVVLVVAMAAAGTARAAVPGLQSAMTRYGICRTDGRATVAGGISSAYKGQIVVVTLMTNGAQLIVRYGRGHHDVTWVDAHEWSDRLFTFRHVRNVPRRLNGMRRACR